MKFMLILSVWATLYNKDVITTTAATTKINIISCYCMCMGVARIDTRTVFESVTILENILILYYFDNLQNVQVHVVNGDGTGKGRRTGRRVRGPYSFFLNLC